MWVVMATPVLFWAMATACKTLASTPSTRARCMADLPGRGFFESVVDQVFGDAIEQVDRQCQIVLNVAVERHAAIAAMLFLDALHPFVAVDQLDLGVEARCAQLLQCALQA